MSLPLQRDNSLDALRGIAILLMVLSSSIAFGILPAWMYHAQTPPPWHAYKPDLAGITWVDLVFPFFLFSMGAAIPLALNKKKEENAPFLQVLFIAVRRYLLLVFFALFTMHARSIVSGASPAPVQYLLQLLAFVLLFCMFSKKGRWFGWLGFAAAAIMLLVLPFNDGKGFLLTRSDIIIVVLGLMAFAGNIIWWITRDNPWLRLGLLPFLMTLLLKAPGSWNELVFNWSPLPWMFKVYYLKYLFVVLPGTLAGEYLLKYRESAKTDTPYLWVAIAGIALIVVNVVCLFNRFLVAGLILSVLIVCALYWLTRKTALLQMFCKTGTYLLLLGFFAEAYEGGIKKDPSTFSYYLVTTGLAFFLLTGLFAFQQAGVGNAVIRFFASNGRNPMLAYVAGNLLLLPLLHITGGMQWYKVMLQQPVTGVLGGIIFTGLVSVVTVWFTRKGWYWKT